MKLFAIALVISMIAGTWSVGGENVLARETTTNKTDEEIHDTGTVEDKTQEKDNTEVAFQNLEDNQEQFTGFAGGDGSEENPYQISTSEMFREMEEYQEQYFVLISDLDLSDSPRINFEGTFDEVLKRYVRKCELLRVRTTNMGSLYELQYHIVLKKAGNEKAIVAKLKMFC